MQQTSKSIIINFVQNLIQIFKFIIELNFQS
jgi:hypothetical protein